MPYMPGHMTASWWCKPDRKLNYHPPNKTVQLPGCDWVFVMSIAPDGANSSFKFFKVLILGHGGSYRGTCSLPCGGRPMLFALAPRQQNSVKFRGAEGAHGGCFWCCAKNLSSGRVFQTKELLISFVLRICINLHATAPFPLDTNV